MNQFPIRSCSSSSILSCVTRMHSMGWKISPTVSTQMVGPCLLPVAPCFTPSLVCLPLWTVRRRKGPLSVLLWPVTGEAGPCLHCIAADCRRKALVQDGLLKQRPLPLGLLISPHTQPSKLSPGAFFWDENRHVGSSKWASISKPWENLGRWSLCYYPLLQIRKPRHLIYVQLVLGHTSGKRYAWDLNLHLPTLQGSVLSFSTLSFHEWTAVVPVWVKLRGQCLPSSCRVNGVLSRAPQRAGPAPGCASGFQTWVQRASCRGGSPGVWQLPGGDVCGALCPLVAPRPLVSCGNNVTLLLLIQNVTSLLLVKENGFHSSINVKQASLV